MLRSPVLARALRRIVRRPGYPLLVVICLALGIAVTTAMLGLLDSLLLRAPDGVRDPDHVVAVGHWTKHEYTTYPDYTELRESAHNFTSLGAFTIRDYTVRAHGAVVPVRALLASSSLFDVLRVPLIRGRFFTTSEDQPGATPVLLVTRGFARGYLARDIHAVGAPIALAGRMYTVIGVLPEGFTAPDLWPVQIVLPIAAAPWFGAPAALTDRKYSWVRIAGRLRAGTSLDEATTEVTGIYRRSNADNAYTDRRVLTQVIVPVQPIVRARRDPSTPAAQTSTWLSLLAALVFFIACGNVAALTLVRALRDSRTTALRVALGATRARLSAPVVLESAGLAAIAGTCALGLVHWIWLPVVNRLLGTDFAPITVDSHAILAALVAAGIAITAVALPAVWLVSRVDPHRELTGGGSSVPKPRQRLLRVLVAAQMGLVLVLTAEAALFGVSLWQISRVPLGIEPRRLLIADVDLRAAHLAGDDLRRAIHQILDRVATLPGVTAVGLTNAAASPHLLTYPVSTPEHPVPLDDRGIPGASISAVTPYYLSALGVPLLGGRGLSDADEGRPVAIISHHLAEMYWPNTSPLGRCIRLGDASSRCGEVIGVVGDRRQDPRDPVGVADVYLPLRSPLLTPVMATDFPGRELAVRTSGDMNVTPALRATLLDVVPALTSVRVRTGAEYLEPEFRTWQFAARITAAFTLVALCLAALGVYGVTSHAVAQRRRDLGVRRALGAQQSAIATLVFAESLRPAIIGALVCAPGALLLGRLTRALAFGVSPVDPRFLGSAACILVLVALLATVPSALTALAADPLDVIRSE